MRKQLSPDVARILRACVAVGEAAFDDHVLTALLTRADLEELPAAAHFHGITGYVVRRLRGLDTDVSRRLMAMLEPYRQHAIRSHLHALADLQEVARALDKQDWLLFKGPALMASVHGSDDLRTYSDLDLLVPPRQLAGVVEAIEQAGFQLLDRNWSLLRRELRGELHARLPHGTVADLHWSLINEQTRREEFSLNTGDMMVRARPLRISGQTVLTLDAVDTLLHLAVHTVLSGGHRLLWFKDVERVLAVESVDWDEVVGRSSSTRLGSVVALTLDQTRRLLGAPVPRELITELAGSSAWQHLAAFAYRVAPPQRSFGYGSAARMVSRATRPTLRSSVRELGQRWSGWARGLGRGSRRDGILLDQSHAGSMSFASGDAVDRQVFFDEVAQQR